jgi:hypothetical protein
MDRRHFLTCCCAFFGGAIVARSAESLSKPKVRAIAGFIALDRSRYEDQIETTLQTLRAGKRMLEAGNYAVESIRIVTQPFPEYVRSFSRERPLRFFQELDTLAAKESFDPNIASFEFESQSFDPGGGQLRPEALPVVRLGCLAAISRQSWSGTRFCVVVFRR